jgi:hypothetical protein
MQRLSCESVPAAIVPHSAVHELVGDPLLYAVDAGCRLLRELEGHIHVLQTLANQSELFADQCSCSSGGPKAATRPYWPVLPP